MSSITVIFLWLIQAATAAPSVAVSYFENTGNDAAMAPLQKGLAEMLITDLSVSKAITIVERSRLNDVLGEVKLQKNPYFDPEGAAKLGRGLGADFLITGSYLVMDDKIRIDARVVDVESSAVVLSVKSMGDTSAWASLEIDLASQLLEGLGAQLSLIDKKNIGKGTTRTFTAFSAYAQAVDHLDEGRAAEAKAALETALAADPDFQRARTSLSAVSERVQKVRKQLAKEASNFEDKVQSMVARYAGGDTQACMALNGVVAQEMQIIGMWSMMSELKSMPSMPGMDLKTLMPQAQNAPKSEKEAGQRLYRIIRLAQATRTQNLKPVQTKLPGGTFTCHPEAVLINSALTNMTGLMTSIQSRRSGQATYDIGGELRPVDAQGRELSDDQILELYLSEANRLLELTPKQATQQYGPMIDWVIKELKTQRLGPKQRAEAKRRQQIDRFIKSVTTKQLSFAVTHEARMGGMVVSFAASRHEPMAMRHMAMKYGGAKSPDGPADYKALIKAVQYSCGDKWCVWPFEGEAPANPHMPKIKGVKPASLLGIELLWPTGISDARPVTILVELVDGRAIEVAAPAPLRPVEKRKLLIKAVGNTLGAMNVTHADERSIDNTIKGFIESADDPLKARIQSEMLGIDKAIFKDFKKLYSHRIEVHADRRSVSLPKAAKNTASSAPSEMPWSMWSEETLNNKTSLKSFRWVTSSRGKKNVQLKLQQFTSWSAEELDSALASQRRDKGANSPIQGHVIHLEAGESVDLRIKSKGFTPEISLAAPGYLPQSFISTTNAKDCQSGFSLFTKNDGESKCLSDWADCSYCSNLARITKVDRSKGVTELRITAPSREYPSFHTLFVGTGSSKIQGDYSLELKARGLEFVKVVPSRKSGAPKPFMMSTTEITNWQWFHVMGETPGICTGIGGGSELAAVCGLNRPAKKINWYQAATFANALSVREGLKPAYAIKMEREPSVSVRPGANGYRLPTLVEWEAAALIDEPMVPLKERCAIANSLELSGVTIGLNDARNPAEAKTASACDDGFGGLAPVASFAPNKFGLYDMLGNVWEWVWDDQESKPKVKGGGYSMLIQNLSPTLTETISPDSTGDPLGMRLVRPLK